MNTPNQTLDPMTRSAVTSLFQLGHHWRAPLHRSDALGIWNMKTLLPVIIALGFLAAGCGPSPKQQAQSEALEAELRIQREELNRLRSELDADRRRLHRSIVEIQARVEDLDRNLNMASTEIWGDGSSTGARLSTAQRTLASIQAEVDSLAMELRTAIRGQ